ncbi:MAG: caspase family protein [Planctomycetota bacterium]
MKSLHVVGPRRLLLTALLAGLTLHVGCAHPNIKVSPTYERPATAPSASAPTALSINVTDQRRFKGTFREDGSEVIASGDKGKVILETPMGEFFRSYLTGAFRDAGFEVRDDAEVTLDVTLRELRFEALAFTHWGLPTDRASTLDLAGVFLPGPPRDTRALTVADIDLSKDGQDVGLSYYIEGYAWDRNAGQDPAVVAQVVSDSWSDAINRIVTNTAPGIPVVAARPMTDEERRANEAAIAAQRAELEEVVAQLKARETQLAADRTELLSIRRELEADRDKLAEQAATNSTRSDALQAQIAELERQLADAKAHADQAAQAAAAASADSSRSAALQAQLNASNAEVAELEKRQSEMNRQKQDLAQYAEVLRQQREALTQQTANLQTQLTEVDSQRRLFADRATELAAQEQAVEQRRGELQDWNLALAEWKTRLAQAESEIQTRESAFRQREAQVAKTEAELQAKADELEKMEIERLAMTEKVAPPAMPDPRNARPIIYVSRPEALSPTTKETVLVTGHVFDDVEVVRTEFSINGRPINPEEQKGIALATVAIANTADPSTNADTPRGVGGSGFRSGSSDSKGFVEFAFTVPLQPGHNRIRVEAWDDRGASDYAEFDVERKTDRGLIHMIAIGINEYDTGNHGVPKLRYAVADAKAVSDSFARNLGITGRHIELYDQEATRSNIIQALRKTLPGNVSKQDTVVVFFSGHGAPETLAGGLGDGSAENLVRYLLPVEAEADNLIGSAIPMQDIARYFRLLPCERLIFLADTCYSGGIAEGGRTVSAEGVALKGVAMSTVSIVERASGQGRVILTASKDNEIAHEKQELGHGVFTYHLVEGLDGAADTNGNQQVTVREIYRYVAAEVPRTTDGSQHPQINDEELRGDIVLSRLN